jgi:hypothetical protein
VSPGARAGTASRARLLSALVAVGALTALIAIGPISPIGPISQASAAPPTGVDQITGNGQTASAVTVSWSQGILGADNTTVVKPRDPSSPLAFMYDDFKNLKVTVGQTQDLVHQAVKGDLVRRNANGGAVPGRLPADDAVLRRRRHRPGPARLPVRECGVAA